MGGPTSGHFIQVEVTVGNVITISSSAYRLVQEFPTTNVRDLQILFNDAFDSEIRHCYSRLPFKTNLFSVIKELN